MSQGGVKVLMKLVVMKENEQQPRKQQKTEAGISLFASVIQYCQEILDITHQNFHLTAMELNSIRKQLAEESKENWKKKLGKWQQEDVGGYT